jgi:hypothetical protein
VEVHDVLFANDMSDRMGKKRKEKKKEKKRKEKKAGRCLQELLEKVRLIRKSCGK